MKRKTNFPKKSPEEALVSSIEKYINKTHKLSLKLQRKGIRTWHELGTGKLDQVDSTIYSVYENRAVSFYLSDVVSDLKDILFDHITYKREAELKQKTRKGKKK